jgi:hypothetical protein
LIDELTDPATLDAVDALIVPLFHVGDVHPVVPPGLPLVDVNFVPDATPALELASLAPDRTVTVVSRSPRGIEVLASIVRQYFRGEVSESLLGTGSADLSDIDIVLYNNGSALSDDELATARRVIKLTSIVDSRSAASLRPRLDGLPVRVA